MLTVRTLTDADARAAWEMGRRAFGSDPDPANRPRPVADVVRWGGFDRDGRLVAKAADCLHGQWWGGRILPASGVASVAVAPEWRGRGAARGVLTALLHGARERGAAVAALFCTSSAVYRSLGFEAAGTLRAVDLPTSRLYRRPPPPGVHVRAGDGTDWSAVRQVYDQVARSGQGLLTRRGPLFPDPDGAELPRGIDGLTVVEDDDGRPVGYATWERGRGYDDAAVLTVPDCLALTADGATALLGVLASWQPVTPTLRLRVLPWADAITTQLPVESLREHTVELWMHRPVDVAAAVAGRGWPPGFTGEVGFRLVDPVLPGNDGAWRLSVSDGVGALERQHGEPDLTVHVRGWSLLWCGVARAPGVRAAGLLAGGRPGDADLLGTLLGAGGPAALLDYF